MKKWKGIYTEASIDNSYVYISFLHCRHNFLSSFTDYHIRFNIEFLSHFSSIYEEKVMNTFNYSNYLNKIKDIRLNLGRHIVSPDYVHEKIYKDYNLYSFSYGNNKEKGENTEGYIILKLPESWKPAIYMEAEHFHNCIEEIVLGVSLL